MPLRLTSPRYQDGQAMPRDLSCEGEELSPPLQWYDLPEGTVSLALVIEDPDAPDPAHPQRTFTHWVVYNLPPNAAGLEQGAASDGLPAGAAHGRNDWGNTDYGGPCPPIGRHRYIHRLYALDTKLETLDAPTRQELQDAMSGHILEEADLVATYEKGH